MSKSRSHIFRPRRHLFGACASIVQRDEPPVEVSPIAFLAFERVFWAARHVIPIGKITGLKTVKLVLSGQRYCAPHHVGETEGSSPNDRGEHFSSFGRCTVPLQPLAPIAITPPP